MRRFGQIRFGIEAFYVKEGTGNTWEKLRNQVAGPDNFPDRRNIAEPALIPKQKYLQLYQALQMRAATSNNCPNTFQKLRYKYRLGLH